MNLNFLKDFQKTTVDFGVKNNYSIYALQMGLGKSVSALATAVKTNSKALIICPAYLRLKWKSEVEKFFPDKVVSLFKNDKEFYRPWDTDFCIISYHYLSKADILFEWADMVIVDECFEGSTKIETIDGEVEIRNISVGDIVRNYTGYGVVEKVFKSDRDEWAEIKYNGRTIKVTLNHPFLTSRGWTEVASLSEGDFIYANNERMYEMREAFQEGRILKTGEYSDQLGLLEKLHIEESCEEELQEVWRGIYNKTIHKKRDRKSGLLRRVFSKETEEGFSGIFKEELRSMFDGVHNSEKSLPESTFSVRDLLKKVLHGKKKKYCEGDRAWRKIESRGFREGEKYPERARPQAESVGGKWESISHRRVTKSENRKYGIREWVHTLWSKEDKPSKSETLQDRFCEQGAKDSHRGGRSQSQLIKGKRGRQEEGKGLTRFRVDSIKIHKRTSADGDRCGSFYNIQVSGHPSYTVNGALVHNCHSFKEMTSQRTQALHRLVYENSIERLLLLTGSPISNRTYEFYSLLALCNYDPRITKSKFLEEYESYVDFANHFSHLEEFEMYRGNKRVKVQRWSGYKNLEELKEYTKNCYIRFTTDEVLDLPPFTEVDVPVAYDDRPELMAVFERFTANADDSDRVSGVDARAKADAALAKAQFTIDYVKGLLDADEQVVVYSDHVDACEKIAEGLGVVGITGQTPMSLRQEMADKFMAGESKVIVATIGSLSTGIDLFSAANMVFNDPPFVPGWMEQAMYRIRRIGQTRRCIFHYIIGSIQDQKIYKILKEKMETIKQVI